MCGLLGGGGLIALRKTATSQRELVGDFSPYYYPIRTTAAP